MSTYTLRYTHFFFVFLCLSLISCHYAPHPPHPTPNPLPSSLRTSTTLPPSSRTSRPFPVWPTPRLSLPHVCIRFMVLIRTLQTLPVQLSLSNRNAPGGVKAQCSNCGATDTPLWRRGLNDELQALLQIGKLSASFN